MKTIVLVIITFFLAGLAHAEEFVYIRSLTAKLYAEPAFSAKQLATVPKDARLVKLAEQGRWFQVQEGEVIGWVAKLLVSPNPPQNRERAIQADSQVGSSARRRASAVATAGAARGLASDDRRRKNQDSTADYRGLVSMEGLALSDAEVIDFLKKGLNK